MKRYLPIPVILILFLFSCKKYEQAYPYVNNPLIDYLPTTAGSTWKYGISISGAGNQFIDTLRVTMTGAQQSIDGKAFAVASENSTASQLYYYKDSGKYKTYWTILPEVQTGASFDVPILLSGVELDRDTTFYIPDADPSKPAWQITSATTQYSDVTNMGKTYNNCVTTYVSINKLYDGTDPQYIGEYQQYDHYSFVFAPNVGIIQEYINFNETLVLTSYAIKP